MKQPVLIMTLALALLAACSQRPTASNAATGGEEANTEQPAAEQPTDEEQPVYEKYTDFALPGTDGKPVSVSDYVGKNRLTLVDFWASWCGPCRAEMPYVAKAYEAFHDKGFEIVGVSLDNDREAWLNAIRELQLMWPQMSDLKGWDCAGAQLYGVQSIPASVLIDQKGNIVDANLRGDDLLNRLSELLSD